MKKSYLIIGILTLCIIFTAAIYVTYQYTLHNVRESEEESVSVMGFSETENIAANEPAEIIVTSKMSYKVETFDVQTSETSQEEQSIPVELLGLNRQEVIAYLKALSAKSKEDTEADTFSEFSLLLFSDNSVVVRETINVNTDKYVCFLIAEDGYVNIYTSDRSDIYLDTSLPLSEFGLEYIPELEKGIYMKSDDELFNFLQNHTS